MGFDRGWKPAGGGGDGGGEEDRPCTRETSSVGVNKRRILIQPGDIGNWNFKEGLRNADFSL